MTVREDMNQRRDKYNQEGNYFMADLIADAFQHMSQDLLDREIKEDSNSSKTPNSSNGDIHA